MSLIPFEQRMVRKGTKRVLEEDEYVEKLEEVIEKQYFPHLKKLKQQLAYIEQNQLFSLHTLRSTYRRVFSSGPDTSIRSKAFPTSTTHSIATSDSWETHSVHTICDQRPGESSNNPQISVTEFFRRFTSEDNDSFEDLHTKAITEHRRKFHWMHESLDKAILDGSAANLDGSTANKKAGMLMLYYVGNKILSAEERERLDAILAGEVTVGDNRPNGLDSWAFRVRNQFMFYPELKDSLKVSKVGEANPILPPMITNGEGQKLLTNAKNIVDEGGFVVPALPRNRQLVTVSSSSSAAIDRRADKVIQRQSTYAPGEMFMQSVDAYLRGGSMSNGPLQGTYSHLIQGPAPLEAPHTPTTIHSSNNGSDWEENSVNGDDRAYSRVRTNNTTTVAMSPAPIPGRGLLESPLITWGTIAATPVLLYSQNQDGFRTGSVSNNQLNNEDRNPQSPQPLVADDKGIQFQFQPLSERERLARRLDDKRKQKKNSAAVDNSSHASVLDTPISIRSSRNTFLSSRSNVSIKTGHSKKTLSDLTPAAQSLAKKLQQRLGNSSSAF